MARRSLLPSVLALLMPTGCTDPVIVEDPFAATGETIAFSGGASGADGACSTCHGTHGQGDGDRAPRLAGLNPGYALRQLENFASGARRHPQMERIARRLGGSARGKVTAYYAGLPWEASSVVTDASRCAGARIYHLGVPARGIASCASCHGASGGGNAGNPPLAGQPAGYLTHALDSWATGTRYGPGDDAMRAISRALDPAQRQMVADYAAALGGDAADNRSARATCLRTRRPDRPDGA